MSVSPAIVVLLVGAAPTLSGVWDLQVPARATDIRRIIDAAC
jgi:hypothetical protein